MKIKAFRVSSDFVDGQFIVIVFAKSAGRAKVVALRGVDFYDCEFIELRARRLKKADKYAASEKYLSMDTASSQQIYREMNFHDLEASCCYGCGDYEFSLLPETHLNNLGYCKVCEMEEINGTQSGYCSDSRERPNR